MTSIKIISGDVLIIDEKSFLKLPSFIC